LVEVPMSVHVPPKRAANEIGISNLEGLILVSLHTVNAIGSKSATTAESLIKAEKIADIKQNVISAIL